MEIVGKRLKWLREKARFSQKEIADLIGMSVGAVQKFEYGQRDPNLEVLSRLCDIYNVSADFILGRVQATDELKKLEHGIISSEARLNSLEETLMDTLRDIDMLEMEISEFKKRGLSADSMKLREKAKSEALTRKVYTEHEISHIRQEHGSFLKKYIEEVLKIPYSKPFMDVNIKRYSPYDCMLQMDLFNNYSLMLSSKKIGYVGYLGEYTSELIADKEKEKLLNLLNGE